LNPTNGPAYFIRAAVKIDLHDFPGASGDVRKSIELGHTNDTAFYFRGLCEFGLKDFTNAESDATTAIDMNTNNADAYDLRGLARGTLRKLDAALDDFNQAVALAPKEAVSYRNRALVEGAQKDYELALADVSKSIQLDAKDGMAYLLRGRIKTALKDYKAALPDFDQAIALNPKDATAYSARGTTRVDMDDFQSATADLEKALQLDPKSVVAYLGRGWLKAKLGGADDETLADFERAVALGGQSPETTAILAAFQYGFSKWVPALQNCRKALELGVFGSTADTMRHYIWLIRTQKGEMTDANMELETYLKSPQGAKAEEWEKCIARFLLGNLTESNFLSQATTTAKRPSAVSGQVCDSLYYAGMKRKLAGDKQGAVAFFQKCLDTTNDNSFAYMNAKVEMRSLRDK
jgi:tetratricopeptide (TPR) repeat protein